MGRATLTDRNANQQCTDEFRRSGDIVGGAEISIEKDSRWGFDGP